eukprot:1160073-Pelagomonas_calceolata.AAC.3
MVETSSLLDGHDASQIFTHLSTWDGPAVQPAGMKPTVQEENSELRPMKSNQSSNSRAVDAAEPDAV